MKIFQRYSTYLPVFWGVAEANPVHVQRAVLLIHSSTWTGWRQCRPQALEWALARESGEHSSTRLCHLLCTNMKLSRTRRPRRELGLPRLVKVSSGANILWVLGVICVYNQQWLLGTCPSCWIISSHLSANVYMGSPECQFGFRLLKCWVWELYKLAGSKSLISRGKGTWGSFWGSGPRVGTRVYVSSCGKDSADLEGGWLPWAPESYTNWSKLFVSLSCIVSEGGASS